MSGIALIIANLVEKCGRNSHNLLYIVPISIKSVNTVLLLFICVKKEQLSASNRYEAN
jgi:hypothetical protein